MPRRWRQRVRVAAVASLLMLQCACQASFFAAVNASSSSPSVQQQRGLRFAETAGLALDIYRPEGAHADAPIMIFYYGGSWRSGQRNWYAFIGKALAAQGMLVVIPDYRTFPQVSFAQLMDDAAAAVAWVQGHRGQVGSSGPLFLAGHSAGAHIAAMLATDHQFLQAHGVTPTQISGLIGIAGPYNFLPIVDPKVAEVFVDAAGADAAQPINHVDANAPPALLLHGSADTTVRPHNSESFAARLRQYGVAADYQLLADQGHVRPMLDIGRDNANGRLIRAAIGEFIASTTGSSVPHESGPGKGPRAQGPGPRND